MAFQFVPPFAEGDKQTNPDTGIEYIYHDGAWRHLGAKIEDDFDNIMRFEPNCISALLWFLVSRST